MTRMLLSATRRCRGGYSPSINILRRWMSVQPEESHTTTARRKVTIQDLQECRRNGVPITMITAYDYPTGRACEAHGIDVTLVGDSLAQVCLGYDSTTRLTLDEMLHHCRAVARGSKAPLLIADMPFGTYQANVEDAVHNAVRLMQEGGVEGLKIEGGMEAVDVVKKLTSIGIPVMPHIGLLPQRHTILSGYKVQGRDARSAWNLVESALAFEAAGAFAIVLEAVPEVVGSAITNRLARIPTIGIGAGPGTNGQVLVWDDVMGTWGGHKAKFVRRFGNVKSEVEKAVKDYAQAVREKSFPTADESYAMPTAELELFMKMLEAGGR